MLPMQEVMILPVGVAGFSEAMHIGVEAYHDLKNVTTEKYRKDVNNVGDEGRFVPSILENREALELLKNVMRKAGYTDEESLAWTWLPPVLQFFKSPDDA
jgi:enolase